MVKCEKCKQEIKTKITKEKLIRLLKEGKIGFVPCPRYKKKHCGKNPCMFKKESD